MIPKKAVCARWIIKCPCLLLNLHSAMLLLINKCGIQCQMLPSLANSSGFSVLVAETIVQVLLWRRGQMGSPLQTMCVEWGRVLCIESHPRWDITLSPVWQRGGNCTVYVKAHKPILQEWRALATTICLKLTFACNALLANKTWFLFCYKLSWYVNMD